MTTLTDPTARPVAGDRDPDRAQRWFGTGHSSDPDARAAGGQATSAALAGRPARLVIVFCSASIDLAAMLEGVRTEAGDAIVIGCTGVAQYVAGAPIGPAVVVSALGGDGFEVRTSVAMNVSTRQRAAGEQVAESVDELTREHRMLLLLCDGLAGEQHELVRGAYGVVGATVPIAGGCAADDLVYAETSQFYSDADGVHVVTDAVVAAAIGSDAPMGVGVAHGWRKVGEPMLATASAGGVIHTLDGRRALDVFVERVHAQDVVDDPAAFRLFAMNHPLGMSRRSGEDIRVIHGGNTADGTLYCLADVPHGTLLWTMESDADGLIAAVDDAYDDAGTALDGATALGFLVFDCGARYAALGPADLRREVDAVGRRSNGVEFAGLYTYGEFARTRGARGMHHMTLVIVAFS